MKKDKDSYLHIVQEEAEIVYMTYENICNEREVKGNC